MNTYQQPVSNRSWLAWALSALLFAAYILLYFGPLPGARPALRPAAAGGRGARARRSGCRLVLHSKWILYGTVYTLAMIAGGAFVLRRHGNSRYQRVRTLTVVAVQVLFAFMLPIVLQVFGRKEYYFSYFWPLKIEYFYPSVILEQPFLIVFWSFLGSLVAFPLLAYFLGKRFYCSWVCGCGGLANTAGEPFRHLSSKSARAWSIEKVSIHTVLFLAVVATAIVWINWAVGKQHPGFARFAFQVQDWYGFAIGAMFAGVLGVGPLPADGHARVVPLRLPDGGAPGPRAEARPLPHHREEGHVHLVRQLLDLLRDGHRRPPVRHGQPDLHPRLLRRLRHVRPRLPARRAEAREQADPLEGRPADPGLRGRPVGAAPAGLTLGSGIGAAARGEPGKERVRPLRVLAVGRLGLLQPPLEQRHPRDAHEKQGHEDGAVDRPPPPGVAAAKQKRPHHTSASPK